MLLVSVLCITMYISSMGIEDILRWNLNFEPLNSQMYMYIPVFIAGESFEPQSVIYKTSLVV